MNVLLDGLSADRARLRDLAGRVIRAGDEERSYIARELHDSTAQSLAAMLLELSVVARETHDPATSERLERIRRIAGDVLDEVRMLAQTVHPRVLDDLGLGAALQHLARESEARGTVTIEVDVDETAGEVSPAVSSVLYRVAQEALNNALRHASARRSVLRAGRRDGLARLEVVDDGVGFRVEEAESRRPAMGLFTMRERIALLDGALEIDSAPGRGTRITARVPAVPVAAATCRRPRPTSRRQPNDDHEGGMTTDLIRVVLADDHMVVRAGLKAVLGTAKDIDVVGEAKDGREAVGLVDRFKPDVVVMDLSMAGMDGTTATKEIVRQGREHARPHPDHASRRRTSSSRCSRPGRRGTSSRAPPTANWSMPCGRSRRATSTCGRRRRASSPRD